LRLPPGARHALAERTLDRESRLRGVGVGAGKDQLKELLVRWFRKLSYNATLSDPAT